MEAIGYKETFISFLSKELNISSADSVNLSNKTDLNFTDLINSSSGQTKPKDESTFSISLPLFFEEFFSEVEEHLKKANGVINFEISARVVLLFNELSEYLLYQQFGDQIKQCGQSIEKLSPLLVRIIGGENRKSADQAWEIIQRKLKINYNKYDMYYQQNFTEDKVKELNKYNKTPPLPQISEEKIMDTFSLVYTFILQIEAGNFAKKSGEDSTAFKTWQLGILDFLLYSKFEFTVKTLDNLLIFHNLAENDENVKAYLEKKQLI